jgi:hypothetical protein
MFKKQGLEPGMVVHACNPSYTGGIGRRITIRGMPLAKNERPYLKSNGSRKGWRYGSNDRVLA